MKYIQKLKELSTLREIALMFDFIPSLDDESIEDVMEECNIDVNKERLESLIRNHEGWDNDKIESEVFQTINMM